MNRSRILLPVLLLSLAFAAHAQDTWVAQTSGTSSMLFGIACPTATACDAAGDSGTFLTTTNGGASWTKTVANPKWIEANSVGNGGLSCPQRQHVLSGCIGRRQRFKRF